MVTGTYVSETETPAFQIAGDFSVYLTEGKLPLAIRNAFRKHKLGLEERFRLLPRSMNA